VRSTKGPPHLAFPGPGGGGLADPCGDPPHPHDHHHHSSSSAAGDVYVLGVHGGDDADEEEGKTATPLPR